MLGRLNIIISGGTGSGKTTTLNVLSSYLPSEERIVTIEDAAELQLNQDHVLSLESRPANLEGKGEVTIRDLVRNALRMRPDRIVLGEVRGGEALDMLQAMNTGHDGSLTTIHANSPRDSLSRVETMVLMSGFDLPVRAIREQIASAVNLIVHIARLRDGSRRVTHVTEVGGIVGDQIELRDLFLFDYGMGIDDEREVPRPTQGDRQPTGVPGPPTRHGDRRAGGGVRCRIPDPPRRLFLRGPMSRMRNVFILALLAGIIGALPAAAQDAEPEPGIEISTLDIDRYPTSSWRSPPSIWSRSARPRPVHHHRRRRADSTGTNPIDRPDG